MISVCLATYNGSQYIKNQVFSILNQLSDSDELIVSDDGSTDDTIDILLSFKDPRINIQNNNWKKGVISNFGNALAAAKGDYIFLSDQDDIWMPEKVAVCTALLQQHDLVVSDCNIIDVNGTEIIPSLFNQLQSGGGIIKNLLKNTYYGCCMCFTRQVLSMVCPFPRHIPMHDIWIGFVADFFFKTVFDKSVLVSYRRHEKNATPFIQSTMSLSVKIINRINLIRYLPLLCHRRLMMQR